MVWAIIIAAALVLYLLYGFVMFTVACRRRKPKDGTDNPNSTWYAYRDEINAGMKWYKAQKTVPLQITSRDGLKLKGYYLQNGDSKNTIILAHGYRSSRFIDFACAFKYYYDLGLNIMSVDMRSHGDSEGKYILFGIAERFDIVDWAKYIDEKYKPDHIILDGMSMGAATVLMTVDLDLPKSVSGVIADCGYTSPVAIWEHVGKRDMHLNPAFIMPCMKLMVKLFTGYDAGSASALESLKKCKIPVLFVHGEADNFVPCEMGRQNFAACASRKTMIIVPGAPHGCSFLIDREKCVKAIVEFTNSILK